ncbi:hypothetical protein [Haloplanus aerogenes]|nr:hypothetical protein [Haloplanus aerogenes]AZH24541.1 hypothetical protein DU502_03705 [Haloplanus aerogenes]
MSTDELETAAREFHEEIPHRFQVSLTMSMETRDRLREVREELNDAAGERVFTTDDAIRLALLSGARYHEVATGDRDASETDSLTTLAGALRRVVDAEAEEE